MFGLAIFQFLFDAVLTITVFFLFHYTINRIRVKNQESDLLKNFQEQKTKDDFRELLTTLQKLGEEISGDIQLQVKVAEEKTKTLKAVILDMEKCKKEVEELVKEDKLANDNLREELKTEKIGEVDSELAYFPVKNNVEDREETAFIVMKEPSTGAMESSKMVSQKEPESFSEVSSGIMGEVYRLADASCGLNDIVRKTNLSRAEIQLILNLRDNRFLTSN